MAEQKATGPARISTGVAAALQSSNNDGQATGAKAPRAPAKSKKAAAPAEPREAFREIVETVVFVVILVLLLKSFVAEAFVIPTGSMAESLYGYQKIVTCPKCREEFPVNCSCEIDPQQAPATPVVACTCPNCRYKIDFQKEGIDPTWHTGDRVLVAKSVYDLNILPGNRPKRRDVVVFKYPRQPQRDFTPMNYIKRLIGLPGETIAIYYGKIYVSDAFQYDDSKVNPLDLWEKEYMHEKEYRRGEGESAASYQARIKKLFDEGKFRMVRKSPSETLAVRRKVYDIDHQARDLIGKAPPRWAPEGTNAWQPDKPNQPTRFDHVAAQDSETAWLRYRHLTAPLSIGNKEKRQYLEKLESEGVPDRIVSQLQPVIDQRYRTEEAFQDALLERLYHLGDEATQYKTQILNAAPTPTGEELRPELITDFMGYNTWQPYRGRHDIPAQNWVGDLMLECDVEIQQAQGELVLELSKGVDRFRVRWDLQNGQCTLSRVPQTGEESAKQAKEELLEQADTGLKKPGAYRLRFANVDDRLTVWVDNNLPFGDGIVYKPPAERGPTKNDLQPASIGVKSAAVAVSHLKLWRDTYYTVHIDTQEADAAGSVDLADPAAWSPESELAKLPVKTLYVQPGHYLCLGDNSPESSDGRSWGTVPERLLLGRALLIYYPFWPISARAGRIQ
jgi:signal peptidase I